MAERETKKPRLSDNLLELKFMQRQTTKLLVKETVSKVNDNNSNNNSSIFEDDNVHWFAHYEDVEIGKPKINVKYMPSYLSFTNSEVKKGRMIFGAKKEPVPEQNLSPNNLQMLKVTNKTINGNNNNNNSNRKGLKRERMVDDDDKGSKESKSKLRKLAKTNDNVKFSGSNSSSSSSSNTVSGSNISNIGFLKPPE
ncbi:hypothetical protein Glove_41g131 [Diversispora epigaea]|uniref:Uncharacterized protein n=1 Tax=Diversispora epigaea TaxID=1348612 RepID=A0A397JIE8_9GLOM|nr:hypothetical protein Glove_41g131 [Diversispora epigaea]